MIYNKTNGMTLLQSVKRDLTMTNLSTYVSDLIFHYAKYNKMDDAYSLSVSDLPDFEVHKFAAVLMADDESYASESTGADNAQYTKTLMPTLIKYLQNTTDRDEEIEFVNAWRDGVANYFSEKMQELIDSQCKERRHDEYEDAGYTPKRHHDNGEIYWSRTA